MNTIILADSHEGIDRLWLDEDGDREESSHLQSLDGVAADIQDTVLALSETDTSVLVIQPIKYIVSYTPITGNT